MARGKFVGWGGLPPSAEFIEYILGIHSDCAEGTITWEMQQLEEHGINTLPFGKDGQVSVCVAARTNADQTPVINVTTNVEFDLIVNWGDGKSGKAHVMPGKKQTIKF